MNQQQNELFGHWAPQAVATRNRAYAKIQDVIGYQQLEVYRTMCERCREFRGGMTIKEVSKVTGMLTSTISGRMNELRKIGLLIPGEGKRVNTYQKWSKKLGRMVDYDVESELWVPVPLAEAPAIIESKRRAA